MADLAGTPWGWAPRREGGVWHAQRRDGIAWCGLRGAALDHPVPEPAGPRCRNCRTALERGDPYRPHGRPPRRDPPPAGDHQDRGPCACALCRDGRKGGAQDYAEALRERVRQVACRCVREWRGADRSVERTAARVEALLLAWEVTGDTATVRDVEEAGHIHLAAWREAARAYELLDGSHPHRRAAR